MAAARLAADQAAVDRTVADRAAADRAAADRAADPIWPANDVWEDQSRQEAVQARAQVKVRGRE